MTDEIAMQKARELAAAEAAAAGFPEDALIYLSGSRDDNWAMQALRKRLREVSDAAEGLGRHGCLVNDHDVRQALGSFLLTKPKPDPLVAAVRDIRIATTGNIVSDEECAVMLRKALAAQGIKLEGE